MGWRLRTAGVRAGSAERRSRSHTVQGMGSPRVTGWSVWISSERSFDRASICLIRPQPQSVRHYILNRVSSYEKKVGRRSQPSHQFFSWVTWSLIQASLGVGQRESLGRRSIVSAPNCSVTKFVRKCSTIPWGERGEGERGLLRS